MSLNKLPELTLAMLSILILSWQPAEASNCLSARIELTDAPRIELFVDLVKQNRKIDCNVKSSLQRLIAVAHDHEMRRKVWKRMLRNELEFAKSASLHHIEKLADACNMPLR